MLPVTFKRDTCRICPSVMLRTSGVCGKILAYQISSTGAFLTHRNTPRNHIWTLAAALDLVTVDLFVHALAMCLALEQVPRHSLEMITFVML